MHRRQQVDEEGEDVEGEDECHGPFEDSGGVVFLLVAAHAKGDSERDFDQDEGELDPEGEAEDLVLSEVHAEPLVFRADENGGDDVAGDEEDEEDIVEGWMAQRVEDRQQDQACCSDSRSDERQSAQNLLGDTRVGCQAPAVSQPALGEEGEVEEDGCYARPGDEEWFELFGPNVGDVGDVLVRVH